MRKVNTSEISEKNKYNTYVNMSRPLHERGFKVSEEHPPYRLSYEIDKSGEERICVDKQGDMIIIYVYDGKVRVASGYTNQASIYQDKGIEKAMEDINEPSSLEELTQESDSDFPFVVNSVIETPKDTQEDNYKQACKLYFFVKRILDVDHKLKTYVPRFSSPSEMTLFNILGIEKCEDILNGDMGE